jgi:hypothetical protein
LLVFSSFSLLFVNFKKLFLALLGVAKVFGVSELGKGFWQKMAKGVLQHFST